MPGQPGVADVYVPTILDSVLIGFLQDETKFASTQVFPMVPTALPQGFVPQWNLGDLYRDRATKRAPGSPAPGTGFTTNNTLRYTCEERAVALPVPDPVSGAAQAPYQLERDVTRAVGQQMLIHREQDWINQFWRTGIWGRDWIGQATADATHKAFWDATGSTPVEDVTQEMDHIEAITGYRPNRLVLGPTVRTGLTNNSELVQRIQYGGSPLNPAVVTDAALAAVFGVEKVIRAAAVVNSAAEGAANVINFMAGRSALLCYAASSPSIWEPSAGYTFAWTGVSGAPGNLGFRVKSYRWERDAATYIEGQAFYDMQQIVPALGTFFSNITAN